MAVYCIQGQRMLHGQIHVQGSKNAALPILAAAVLNSGITRLNHCPRITDVEDMCRILELLGCTTRWVEDCLEIDSSTLECVELPVRYAAKVRASVVFMGALLARCQKVCLPYPGGCTIGQRPVDWHLKMLEAMGASVTLTESEIICSCEGLTGTRLTLPFPSVGVTENLIMAALGAKGDTTIINAAKEPEIIELCHFLNDMGAYIMGMGTGTIMIQGQPALKDVTYTLGADRIVAGTYLMAAAATGGCVELTGVRSGDLRAVIDVLVHMGCGVVMKRDSVKLIAPEVLLPVELVETRPFPGFPTDLQSQLMVLLTRAEGRSCISENIFEERFKIVNPLKSMGARIEINASQACIYGPTPLRASQVTACDLRGGAALILAGMIARGETIVRDSAYILRGYEDIARDLNALGGKVRLEVS